MGAIALKVGDNVAGIQTTIQIIDKATAPMVAMQNAAEELYNSLNRINDASMDGANEQVEKFMSAYDQVSDNIEDSNGQQEKLNRSVRSGAGESNKLASTIKKVATAYLSMQTAKKAIDLSDTLALSQSRLSLIVDDDGSVDNLEDKTYASAQRSRASYQDTVDVVSKLGLLAGDAFKNNDELIAFTELMNKNFAVGGASATEQASAMYQLTQAMASGRLQGDEYRSIIENAPLLAKSIEDYMINVQGAQGTMKDWASEGMLTADVIKNALFSSADEVESRFNGMPMTFGQIWTSIKNNALTQFQPILKKISEIANNSKTNKMVNGLTNGISKIAAIAGKAFDILTSVGGFIYDNWSRIKPLITGIVAGLILYNGILIAHNAIETISNGIKSIAAARSKLKAGASFAEAAGTTTASGAQLGLNAAIWACPVTWIIAAIMALIVCFAVWTDKIVGAIWWLGALFKNIGLWFANVGIAAWKLIKNIGLWFADLGLAVWTAIKNCGLWFANLGLGIWEVLKACASNVASAFKNAWIGIQIGFWSVIRAIVEGVKTAIEWLNKIPGVNISTSGLTESVNGYTQKMAELEAEKHDYKNIGEAWDKGFSTYAYDSVSDAWNKYDLDWGEVSEGYNTYDDFADGWGSSAYNRGAEIGGNIKDWMDDHLSIDSILGLNEGEETTAYDELPDDYSDYLSSISDNTENIADSASIAEEDIKYLRDIAERDVVNRFTTAEVKIDLGGITNNVSSGMDLDGMIMYLSDKMAEELEIVAEGVHS